MGWCVNYYLIDCWLFFLKLEEKKIKNAKVNLNETWAIHLKSIKKYDAHWYYHTIEVNSCLVEAPAI